MYIAIEGCCHGELDNIYDTIKVIEKQKSIKVDMLICCGDFQAVRNGHDLECMAVPQKHRKMQTFWQYYQGIKKAHVLTIFIGGNHEASNYLQVSYIHFCFIIHNMCILEQATLFDFVNLMTYY